MSFLELSLFAAGFLCGTVATVYWIGRKAKIDVDALDAPDISPEIRRQILRGLKNKIREQDL